MQDRPGPRWWATPLRWTAAIAVVVLVCRLGGVGLAQVRTAAPVIAGVDRLLVAGIVGLEVVWAVALAQTSRSAVLALGGSLPLRGALRISMGGFTLSRVVPGGGAAGGAFAVRELHRLGLPVALAAAAAVTSWATSVVALGALVVGGLAVAATTPAGLPASSLPTAAALLVLSITGAVVLAALRRVTIRRAVVARLDALRRRVPVRWRPRRPLPPDVLACDRAAVRRSLVWAGLAWSVDVAAMGVALAACGATLAPGVLLVGYVVATLLNSAPELTPGWIGVFEAAQATTFTALGVEASTAVAGVLLYRLLSFWLPTAAGIGPLLVSLRPPRPTAPPTVAVPREVAA